MSLDPAIAALLKRNPDHLVPAVVQDASSRQVLMLAWMDDEALARTLATRKGTYFSRSRQQYWVKGETSGQVLHVKWIRTDCDADGLLVGVDPVGPVCHDGYASCFYREWRGGQWEVCAERLMTPEELYGKKA